MKINWNVVYIIYIELILSSKGDKKRIQKKLPY